MTEEITTRRWVRPPRVYLLGATLNAILTLLYVLADELTYTPVTAAITILLLWAWAYSQEGRT